MFFLHTEENKVSADTKISRWKRQHRHTPQGRRPRAWPAWPAAGLTRPARRWGSWWWSAGHAPATPPHTPARCQRPRRRSGAPAAPRRSCRGGGSLMKSRCSWMMSERKRRRRKRARRRRRWGRMCRSVRGQRWGKRRNSAPGRREGRREGGSQLTRWVKSWSHSGGHGRPENRWYKERREINDPGSRPEHTPLILHNKSDEDLLHTSTTEENKRSTKAKGYFDAKEAFLSLAWPPGALFSRTHSAWMQTTIEHSLKHPRQGCLKFWRRPTESGIKGLSQLCRCFLATGVLKGCSKECNIDQWKGDLPL